MRTEFAQITTHSMTELEDALNQYGAGGWQLHSWRTLASPSGIHVKYLAIVTRNPDGRTPAVRSA